MYLFKGGSIMSMISKIKNPEVVTNPATADYYQKNGVKRNTEEATHVIGYRFDCVNGITLENPDGRKTKNNVTYSQPSSEVLTLLKDGENWFLVMGKQSRSPYAVEVNGTLYCKVFFEQAAGLVEANQDFQSAAIAEASQELGSKVIFLSELIVPKLYRHVSYTDEVSRLYWAITEKLGEQHLDYGESINVSVFPLNEAKEEFKAYIDGQKSDFFGFDIPDVTMLSMALFFWKLDSGEIDLNNPKGNLL